MKNCQQLNCSIPQSDYNLFKGVAFLKGKKVNEAFLEAIVLWLKEATNEQQKAANEREQNETDSN